MRVVRTLALTRPKTLARYAIIALLAPYAFWLTFHYRFHFIDGVNLLIHEAGHIFFLPLGETAHFLGGTILQIAIPLAFCAHFVRRGDRFSGAVMGVWVGESIINVARYMSDAIAQELPLVGGGVHDWHWLLSRAGLIRHTEALSSLAHISGAALAVSSVWMAWQFKSYAHPIVGVVGDDDPEVVTQREEAAQAAARAEASGFSGGRKPFTGQKPLGRRNPFNGKPRGGMESAVEAARVRNAEARDHRLKRKKRVLR